MTIDTDAEEMKAIEILIKCSEESIKSNQIFFEEWKKGVKLAGYEFFGDGTKDGFEKSSLIDDLRPIFIEFKDALKYKSPAESAFLASLYSFYNSDKAADLCKILKLKSVGDLTGLDTNHRHVIANLLVNYRGW